MRAFGEDERGARLPSAALGLASIPVLWSLVRRRFGATAAIAAATVLALMPLHVAHSRSARFYAAFVLAYGLAGVLASHALEKRSWRGFVGALAAFAVALELQILAVTILLPLIAQFLWFRRRDGSEGRSPHRIAMVVLGAVAAALAVVFIVPSLRDGAVDMLRNPVPAVRFSIGIHLDTLRIPFAVVSWWAWLLFAPLAVLGLRRAGRWGGIVALHLSVPLIVIAILYEGTGAAGFSSRYLLQLLPFVAVIAGVGVGEGVRLGAGLVRRAGSPAAARGSAAVAAAAMSVTGILGVPGLPSEKHPTKLIPRPNWNAAGAVIRAHPDDALLSTAPLAMSWVAGRCGDWIRKESAAAVYMVQGRDVYCGTRLVPDVTALGAYLAAHPRGWLVADPRQWPGIVDRAVVDLIARTARPVDTGDRSILVFRWG